MIHVINLYKTYIDTVFFGIQGIYNVCPVLMICVPSPHHFHTICAASTEVPTKEKSLFDHLQHDLEHVF